MGDLPGGADLCEAVLAASPPVRSECEGRQDGHLDPWRSRRGPAALVSGVPVPPGPAGSRSAREGRLDPWHSRRGPGPAAQGSRGLAAQSPEHGACGGDKRVESCPSWRRRSRAFIHRCRAPPGGGREGHAVSGLATRRVFRNAVWDGLKKVPLSSDPNHTRTAPPGEPNAPVLPARVECDEAPSCGFENTLPDPSSFAKKPRVAKGGEG